MKGIIDMGYFTKNIRVIISLLLLIFTGAYITGCTTMENVSLPGIMLSNPEAVKTEAVEVIKKAANSNDSYVKTYAMEALSKAQCDGCAMLIQQALNDTTVSVRVAAAIAAGDMQIIETREALEKMCKDKEPMVQLAAGYALEKMNMDAARFRVWYDKALKSSNSRYAGQSCLLVGKLGITPTRNNSKAKLRQVMKKPNQKPYIRLQAAEALARLGDTEITERLLDFAGSSFADDRLLTVSALKELGCKECYAMLSVLASDEQIEVSLSALRALGPLAGKEDVVPAYRALEYIDPYGEAEVTKRVRHLAILAIGSFGNEMDQSLLKRYLNDKDEFIRLTAAVATIEWKRIIDRRYTSRF